MEINLTPDSSYPNGLTDVLISIYQRVYAELSALNALEPLDDDVSKEAQVMRAALNERRELIQELGPLVIGKRVMPFPSMPISLN